MNLKQARAKNKLSQFIKEREKDTPKGSKKQFNKVVKAMALKTSTSKRGTSKKGSPGC